MKSRTLLASSLTVLVFAVGCSSSDPFDAGAEPSLVAQTPEPTSRANADTSESRDEVGAEPTAVSTSSPAAELENNLEPSSATDATTSTTVAPENSVVTPVPTGTSADGVDSFPDATEPTTTEPCQSPLADAPCELPPTR